MVWVGSIGNISKTLQHFPEGNKWDNWLGFNLLEGKFPTKYFPVANRKQKALAFPYSTDNNIILDRA